MADSRTDDHYEFACNPGIQVHWGLHRIQVGQGGTEGAPEVIRVNGPLEIEQVIDRHRHALDRIVRVVGTLWTREFHLADGQLIKYRVLMEVTDWRCADCSVDIREIEEFYAVHDDLWHAAAQGKEGGQLCIGCFEVRLGRELTRADFKNERASLNGRYSERLRERENRTHAN